MSELFHPRKEANRAQFYPHSATIKATSGDAGSDDETNFDFADVDDLIGLACKVVQTPGARSGEFQNEAPARDSVLFQDCHSGLKSGQILVVEMAGVEKWFDVLDVAHIARESQTFATLQAR